MSYYPSLEEVKRLAKQGNLIPVYRDIQADLETPVSAYLKLARGNYSFLLESVEGGERIARYSFLGTEPYLVLRLWPAQGDPLVLVERELKNYQLVPVPGLPRFHGGAVGYLSYEVVRHYENLPTPESDPLGVPESVFMFVDNLLVFDHLKHQIKVVAHVHTNGDIERSYQEAVGRIEDMISRLRRPVGRQWLETKPKKHGGPSAVVSNLTPQYYQEMVRRARDYIIAGDIVQVVLSQRLSRPTTAHPFAIYRALRGVNPSPYMFYLHLDDFHLVGASPELLVRVEDGQIDYRPLAGTRRRGATPEEDEALEEELRADEKERAEHLQLLDLGRNDVGRVAEVGSVSVPEKFYVVRYSHVMHLESHVQGQLRKDLSPLEALRACIPAGTLSGAPKVRAMEIIAELEPDRRGPYGGAVGYFDFSGNLDTCITIRTLVIKDGVAHAQAGGGIVYDSVPEQEYQESLNKATAGLRALEMAERGD